MIHHLNEGNEFLFVDITIPDVKRLWVKSVERLRELDEYEDVPFPADCTDCLLCNAGSLMSTYYLPAGEWELIGRGDELTAGQAREIVAPGHYGGAYLYYKGTPGYQTIYTRATSSFASLLQSHSLTPSTTVVLRKKK